MAWALAAVHISAHQCTGTAREVPNEPDKVLLGLGGM